MKTQIFFVRHGEVFNPKNIWYGRLPRHQLSAKGRLQIEDTAKYLADKNIDIIYSSLLLRARQSAEILKEKLNLPKVHFSEKLLEVKSSLQGNSDIYMLSINYDFYNRLDYRKRNDYASREKKITGETIEQVSGRMQEFIDRILKFHKGKNIVVVSHGDPIMVVKLKATGLPLTIKFLRRKDQAIGLGEVYCLKI